MKYKVAFFVWIIAVSFGGLGLYTLLIREMQKEAPSGFLSYSGEARVGNVYFETFTGEKIALRDIPQDFIVLNFWASWCSPCLKELPSLQALQDNPDLDGAWRVIAVSIDLDRGRDKAAELAESLKVQPVADYIDAQEEFQNFLGIKQLPVTYIIGPDRRVYYYSIGDRMWNSSEVISFLKALSRK